ncbi:MAG: hypothetical protein MRY63_10310 [Neomegalonema sp.]|nr:hypothetical protein [Neomegalonema sp.]
MLIDRNESAFEMTVGRRLMGVNSSGPLITDKTDLCGCIASIWAEARLAGLIKVMICCLFAANNAGTLRRIGECARKNFTNWGRT